MHCMIHTSFRLAHRTLIALSGPDTLSLLERLVTHDTQNWDIGSTRYGGLLTPQGKVICDWLAVRTPEGVVLEVDAGLADELVKQLTLFRLRSQVSIERRRDLAIWVLTPDAKAEPDQVQLRYQDPRYTPAQRRIALPAGAQMAQGSELSAYHAERIRNGIVEQVFDFLGRDVFPADINMDIHEGVALHKGCFVGQEVVSRMHRRGTIRKRTIALTAEQDLTDISPGAEVIAGTAIGIVTSIAPKIALARIRTDRLAKALQDGQAVHSQSVKLILVPIDWLIEELSAMHAE